MIREQVIHPLEPIYNNNSKVLILGTMPSPVSRQQSFYYAHPQNRFWKVMFEMLGQPFSIEKEDRIKLCLDNGIALWDVLKSCTIEGASDSSIKNAVPNDLSVILGTADIKAIFTTGQTAGKLYKKLCCPQTGIEALVLPSPSGANCAIKIETLLSRYSEILKYL